ncbi:MULTISPECIES: glycoside hydrolase domain-containing protein [Lacticaseibacillus]|uniref:glycoside hydrolase domain-containing protein n=1 Tax=Lacticaseibacillus TaxID=2759736 RepID=UPI00280C364C|nr:glycoside hydrolase domain-containing protein [Lacticaseibacillus rhamnosus]
MADEAVRAVQKWLNKTYGSVPGFVAAPENGQTGWPTIYSLRMGLQHEIGISEIGEGFGDTTKNALAPVVGNLKPGYKGNIAQLIQGAFWCKGISPTDFNNELTQGTMAAVQTLQSDAGVTADGIITVPLMAALFDMAAFSLVQGGNPKIRAMQQYLNSRFASELKQIMPCDGIYQRDTNTALIYALQRAEGMSPDQATGTYGDQTIARCPVLSEGSSDHDAVRVLQYGLLANGYNDVATDGIFSSQVGNLVAAFSTRMNLEPVTGRIAGNRVIKGLLTSNGDTQRDSIVCDTSKILTSADVATLKKYGFKIVGRYLTGTVGNDFRDKALSTAEIETITDGGLSVFPIYQDGGAEVAYFTEMQGVLDAFTAVSAARVLGFPENTVIYFACDVDIQEGNIDYSVVPYMKGVNDGLAKSGFKAGIYGTRNVCTHVMGAGYAVHCFVADMSTGYSGNLGYAMPQNWSFDQFVEYNIGDLPIDQVAADVKISDPGVTKFTPGELPEAAKIVIVNDLMNGLVDNILNFSFGKEYSFPVSIPGMVVSWSANASAGKGPIKINNGHYESADFEQVFENKVGPIKNSTAFNAAIDKTGIPKIGLKVSEGSVDYAISITPINAVEIDFTYNIIKGKKLENADVNIAIKWKIIFTPQYWQDHPEVKETERPAFATGWAFDLAGSMGETFKVSLETLITAAIAAGILIAGAAVIG